MVKIQIDGKVFEATAGKNLLETCISLGLNVPYFCYHPALGSVGACRQCAVKKHANGDDKTGKIIMSCMEPVTDGMVISLNDPGSTDFRASVIEGLMTNHPHDCPVCDEGGECHLQDMTVMTGHNYRRYIFKKRTHLNQNLGPFIHHEMNRCIQCYRCVRFYREYAGGNDLNVYGSANNVYFGRQNDGILESEFSGNLVEVCPTGVFTDKTLKKHYTRKWDLTHTPSVCVHCSVGCNTLLGERYGSVRRVMSRYNGDVNGYFLCDRGRFGYEFLNHPARIKKALGKNSEKAFTEIAERPIKIEGFSEALKNGRVIGIGSPRASLEANFALSSLVGTDRFFNGISRPAHQLVNKALQLLQSSTLHTVSLQEIEQSDALLILGEDITQTAPVMALSVRQATRNKALDMAGKMGIPKWHDSAARELAQNVKSPLYIVSPFSTKLDDVAAETFRMSPDDTSRLAFAVAACINGGVGEIPEGDNTLNEKAQLIAASMLEAQHPVIITGTGSANEEILNATANLALALSLKNKKAGLAIVFNECNTAGIGLMQAGCLDDGMDLVAAGSADMLVVMENDLYRSMDAAKVDAFLEQCKKIVVIDHFMHATGKKADIFLPAAPFAESSGTLVNHEGRAQRYYPVLPAADPVKESWQWISHMMAMAGKENPWSGFDSVVDSMVMKFPVFAAVKSRLPDAGFRFYNEKIARQTMRFSGRTAIQANIAVSEPKPEEDPDSPMNYSMEGYKGNPPANLIPYFWSPGWNSQQAVNKYLDEPNGSVRDSDPGIRLIENNGPALNGFYKSRAKPFAPKAGEIYIVPVFKIFGSDELSSYGEAIAELIPEPFVLINEKEISKIQVDRAWLELQDHKSIQVKIVMDNSVPDGIAGFSVQLPEMPYTGLAGWGRIRSK